MCMIDYKKITDFMVISGKRLVTKAGQVKDIGITKTDLTEEDLAIENGLHEIIDSFDIPHTFYSEEVYDIYVPDRHIWIADPISGTLNFINNNPHYAIVVSHILNGEVVFAAVYDPSADELFTASKGKGSYLNGKSINVSNEVNRVLIRESMAWQRPLTAGAIKQALHKYQTEENQYSMALNYCWVAQGKYGGIVSLTKDTFPEFAGSLIIQEAGGIYTNQEGNSISVDDRIFVGGNKLIYPELLNIVKKCVVD